MFLGIAMSLFGKPDNEVTGLDRVVQAIEAVENSPWSSQGGGLQFKPVAWFEETTQPYHLANNRDFARQMAVQRLGRQAQRLREAGITPTPYILGSIWNKGWQGALKTMRSGKLDPYGERVHNYFHAYTTDK